MYLLTNVLQDRSKQRILTVPSRYAAHSIRLATHGMVQALHAFWLKNTTAVVGYVLEALAIDWNVTIN
jgi:hypothetical protein